VEEMFLKKNQIKKPSLSRQEESQIRTHPAKSPTKLEERSRAESAKPQGLDRRRRIKAQMKERVSKISLRLFARLPAHEKRITVATMFTIGRILVVPLIVFAMVLGQWGAAFGLFLGAAVTDSVDGSIARYFDQKTFLGACLDPLADKLLLLSIFSTLAFINTPLFVIPQWFVALVLLKEVLQITGAVILYLRKGHLEVNPTFLGKATMLVQVVFICWLFACYFFNWMPVKTYHTMLGLMLIMIFAAFMQYVSIGLRYLKMA
jgi:cardiolipin synthase